MKTAIVERLWLRTSYDYLDSKNRTSGSNDDKLQYRPEHRVTFEASYALPWWGLSVYGSTWWVADSYYNPRLNVDTNPQKTLDNYWLADCRINKATKLGGTDLDMYVGVNNLFDEDYEQSYGYPAGRPDLLWGCQLEVLTHGGA